MTTAVVAVLREKPKAVTPGLEAPVKRAARAKRAQAAAKQAVAPLARATRVKAMGVRRPAALLLAAWVEPLPVRPVAA
jgi:hypothetical protein